MIRNVTGERNINITNHDKASVNYITYLKGNLVSSYNHGPF